MGVKYGHKWSSQFPNTKVEAVGKDEWGKELVGFSMNQVLRAIDKLVDEFPSWPPTIGEFKKLCFVNSGHSFPNIEDAWLEICSEKPYKNGIVFAMSRDKRLHHYDWVRMTEVQGLRRFAPIYKHFIDRAFAGEVFDLPDKPMLENRVGKAVTRQEKKAVGLPVFAALKISLKPGGLSLSEKTNRQESYYKFRGDLEAEVSAHG